MINSILFFMSVKSEGFLKKIALLSKITDESILNLKFQNGLDIQSF
jgi:hypothetical protein